MAVDNQRVDAELMQTRGDRQAALAAADHNDCRIVVGVGARSGETVAPVLRAEVAYAVVRLRRAAAECLLVSLEFFQRRDDRPCAQPRRSIGNKPDNAGAGTEGGFEFEQGLDGFRSGARQPARRCSLCRKMKMSRLRARECFAQHCLDCRPAGQSLDGPGEGQHVAPETVGQKQFGGRRCVLRLQCRVEALQPALRIRRRRCLFSFSDVHHCLCVRRASQPSCPRLSRASTSS